MISIDLKPGRDASVRRRHPWLFSGAVARTRGDGEDGLAEVLDAGGRRIAAGAWSPASQIVARLWTFGDGPPPGPGLFAGRFAAARRFREAILPPATTGFRAVNSEGDLCPGVLLDVYDDLGVLDLSTEGTERWEEALRAAALEQFRLARILVRRTGHPRDRGSRR